MARRAEWQQQVKLASLLDKWLDPACTFATATDPVAPSALAGAMRKKRGVKPGVPDTLVWCHYTKPIGIEMKSPGGRCSASQRATREALMRAGAEWWECRSAHAAMWALRKSGVRFRVIVHDDGTTERWRQPRLAPWEVPRRDPAEPRPDAPDVVAQRRASRQRRRERLAVPQDPAACSRTSSRTGTNRGARDSGLRHTRTETMRALRKMNAGRSSGGRPLT
ncbi:VRR-NUC domain-containing protein [Bradyrhizobium sp. Ec3.3]|uniref:VRR-NUC domain-containing protein n=1 Tax=Bradyrhizobium sp. Ec3.3 TaxID=189753 RepID=UPI0009FFC976